LNESICSRSSAEAIAPRAAGVSRIERENSLNNYGERTSV